MQIENVIFYKENLIMAKYNPKSVYGTLFVMMDEFSEEDKKWLFEKEFTEKFLNDIDENPKSAYSVLNKIVKDIEDGKTNKTASLLKDYEDKLFMMKAMLKDYGNF